MIKRLVFVVLICLIPILFLPEIASADILDNPQAFEDGLPQEGKYIKNDYRPNYSLDIEDPGFLGAGDSAMNAIANILFSLILFIGHLITIAFYRASEFDLVILFSKQIQDILQSLNTTFFKGFFILAVAFASCQIIVKMLKDNISGMVQDLVKIVVMCVISVLVITNAPWILSSTSTLAKELSAKVLMDVSGVKAESTPASYNAASCTALWKSLVHDPWISLEFGGLKPDEATVESFLKSTPGSDDRQKLVKDYKAKYKEDAPTVFDKTLGGSRIAILLMYIIPFLLKALLIGGLCLAQIFLQFCAIGVLILAPAIILLAVIPYFGFPLIGNWLKKIVDFHISMVALAFTLGLFLRFDTMLYGMATGVGWLFIIFIELGIAVAIILNLKHILRGISAFTQAVHNPSSGFSGRVMSLQSMSMPHRRKPQQRPRLENGSRQKKMVGSNGRRRNNNYQMRNNGNQRSSSSRPVSRPMSKPSVSRVSRVSRSSPIPPQQSGKYKIKDWRQSKANTPKSNRKPDVHSIGLKSGFEAHWQDGALQPQKRQRPKSSQPPKKRSA